MVGLVEAVGGPGGTALGASVLDRRVERDNGLLL